jgi:hypothetical protein
MSDKLPKALVLYVFNPGSNYCCNQCAYLGPDDKCTAYVKDDDEVHGYGSCNLWCTAKAGYIKGDKNWTRTSTGYTENEAGFSCARCEEFIADSKRCKKVDEYGGLTPGIIHPRACCSRWEKSPQLGDLSEAKLRSMPNYR